MKQNTNHFVSKMSTFKRITSFNSQLLTRPRTLDRKSDPKLRITTKGAPSGFLYLVGATYMYRAQLTAIGGGYWNHKARAWVFPISKFDDLDNIVVAANVAQQQTTTTTTTTTRTVVKAPRCSICNKTGHTKQRCRVRCSECQQTGHVLNDCPVRAIRRRTEADSRWKKFINHPTIGCHCNETLVCEPCKFVCCKSATINWCKCTISWNCPLHARKEEGRRCVGTHD